MPPVTDPRRWHPSSIEGRGVVLRRHRPENLSAVLRWYRDPELARLTRYQVRAMATEEIEAFFRARLLSSDALAYAIHGRVLVRQGRCGYLPCAFPAGVPTTRDPRQGR